MQTLTLDQLTAAIHRCEVSARDTRFDAQMRGMFRKAAASHRRALAARTVAVAA